MPRRLMPVWFDSGIPSNFYHAPIEVYVWELCTYIEFQRNENYFQARKVTLVEGTETQFLKIAYARSGSEAKRLGGQVPLTEDQVQEWNERFALVAMLECNLAKYQQNEDCRNWLLATGHRPLVEHRPDKVWGDGMDGSGKNQLGKTLELVRTTLR